MNLDDPQELERYEAAIWYWLLTVAEEATATGAGDIRPGAEMGSADGWTWCRLPSATRPVEGRIETALLERVATEMGPAELDAYRSHARAVGADVILPVALQRVDDLEAKRAAPNRKRTATSEAKANRAREIIDEGKGWAYVVDRATAEGLIKIRPTGRDGHPREPEEIHELAIRSLKRLIAEK